MNGERNILIVEDDPTLLRVLSDSFQSRGFHVNLAANGEEGLRKGTSSDLDLLILDVMLPGVNGYEICRYLRSEEIGTPIIFLTAKGEESDILLGLGLGADDYLAKPFSIRELMARVDAVLRRSRGDGIQEEGREKVVFGDFELDRLSHKLRRIDGSPVKLSPKEYDLLEFLVEHRGEALSRQRIMDSVWGHESRVTYRSIDRFMTSIRKKIERRAGEHIETIREYGYRFRVAGNSDSVGDARSVCEEGKSF